MQRILYKLQARPGNGKYCGQSTAATFLVKVMIGFLIGSKIFSTLILGQILPSSVVFPWTFFELNWYMLAYLAIAFLIGNGAMLLAVINSYFSGLRSGISPPVWLLILVVMYFVIPITHLGLNVALFEVLMIAFGFAVFWSSVFAFFLNCVTVPCSIAIWLHHNSEYSFQISCLAAMFAAWKLALVY